MKKLLYKILKTIVTALAIYQIVAWVGIGCLYKSEQEQPMSDIRGFIVDDYGNMIISDGFYSGIQVYDKQGKFVTRWSPHIRNYDLQLGYGNTIIIKQTTQNNYFTLNGKEIKNEILAVSNNQENNLKNYKFAGTPFFPKIIKTVNNKEQIIVQQSIIMGLLKAPFPFCGLSLISFFGLAISGVIKQEREKGNKKLKIKKNKLQ